MTKSPVKKNGKLKSGWRWLKPIEWVRKGDMVRQNGRWCYVDEVAALIGFQATSPQAYYRYEATNRPGPGRKAEPVGSPIKGATPFGLETLLENARTSVATPRLFTPRIQSVLNCAQLEARELGASYVGTDHLLLALLKVCEPLSPGNLVADTCKKHNLTYTRVKAGFLAFYKKKYV